jgi:hypothetical protein
MQSRNDQPNIANFNFAVDSVFNNVAESPAFTPILPNQFLLMNGMPLTLLDGEFFLLLGT